MTVPVRVVTLAGDPEQEAGFSAQLHSHSDCELILRCVDRAELLGAIRGAALDALVSIGAPPWFDRQCSQEASDRGIRIVGVADDLFEGDRLRALGGSVLPFTSTVSDILDACTSQALVPAPSPPHSGSEKGDLIGPEKGDLIAIWGPKGAPGRTRIALELSFELSANEPQTLLIDGDPYGGDILQLLAILDELPTVIWASRMAAKDELCLGPLEELHRTKSTGPLVLPGIPRAELWAEISDYGWRALLKEARRTFRFTICDVGFSLEPEATLYTEGEGRNRMARAAVSAADHVVAVCRGDAIGVKNFVWSFQQLTELVAVDDILVVVNRVDPSEEQQVDHLLKRFIGKHPVVHLPDRPAVYGKAVETGELVSGRPGGSESASAMKVLAEAMGARVPSQGLLSRMAGKR